MATQDLYDAIKSVNPNVGVLMNTYNNQVLVDNSYGLFDSSSIELDYMPETTSYYWAKTQTKNNITYPMSKEICSESRVSKWFYSSTPAALKSLATIQVAYNIAKTIGIPIAFSINPKLDGVIDQAQADLVGSLTL